jgi:hypothetical protein
MTTNSYPQPQQQGATAQTVAARSRMTLELRAVPPHRVLLIGRSAFAWLRVLQERAPAPRLEMRYLIEGIVLLLIALEEIREPWLAGAREAMFQHMAAQRQIAANRCDGPAERAAQEQFQGTGRSLVATEGAQARTPASPSGNGRHDDCKALQIGEASFLWLRGVQGLTRDPRLEIRYLVEGALALLQQRTDLLPEVVGHARQALSEHLSQLQQHPVEPFRMEIST